jgi:hypothetical protein
VLTKLVSENIIDWDEHMFTMLFSYKIAYKGTTRYTPYQLMYGLHPLVPIEFIVPIVGGIKRNNISMRVLTSRIIELEKLQQVRNQAAKTIGIQ